VVAAASGPRGSAGTRPAEGLRHRTDRPGQAGRPAARMDDRGLHALPGAGGQAVQDVPGDVAAIRGCDPGVLVDEPAGWRAYFCTEPAASVADILAAVADRFSVETAFRDCKEVVGGSMPRGDRGGNSGRRR